VIGGAIPTDWLLTVDGVTAFIVGGAAGALYVIIHWGRPAKRRPRKRPDPPT
jgi:hypothetical protein